MKKNVNLAKEVAPESPESSRNTPQQVDNSLATPANAHPMPAAPSPYGLYPMMPMMPPFGSFPMMPMYPFPPNAGAMNYAANPFLPYNMAAQYGHHSTHLQSPGSSPIRDAKDIMSNDTFCAAFGLDDDDLEKLNLLKFRVTDNLAVVSEEDWRKIGFTPLSWERVKKVQRKYQKSKA